MSDLEKYINSRKNKDKEFASGFDEEFKIGVMLREIRKNAGMTHGFTQNMVDKLTTKIINIVLNSDFSFIF